jgi:hypothetical protein
VNENESFMTAAEMCEADHPYDFAVANPRVPDETRAGPKPYITREKLDEVLKSGSVGLGDIQIDLINVQLASLARCHGDEHVRSKLYGIVVGAILDGLRARAEFCDGVVAERAEQNKPVSA